MGFIFYSCIRTFFLTLENREYHCNFQNYILIHLMISVLINRYTQGLWFFPGYFKISKNLNYFIFISNSVVKFSVVNRARTMSINIEK